MATPLRCSAVYPTLAVRDVQGTCDWYVKQLGFSLRFLWGDPPRHGAVMLDKACVHFWQGTPQLSDNWLYFDIDSVEHMFQLATANQVQITRMPETYPWGMREFNALDLNGYHLRFGQHMGNTGSADGLA